jgi:DNA-binding IclR family transcriptional regulator
MTTRLSRQKPAAFARKVLKLVVAAGDHGLELHEVALATGASVEEVADMLARLEANGYLKRREPS